MGWNKTHDLTVVTGSYQKDGETKKRYENVGQVLTNDDGEEMLLLKRSFNPAGVPFKDGSDQVIIGKFAVRDDSAPRQQAPARQQSAPRQQAPQSTATDDDCPF